MSRPSTAARRAALPSRQRTPSTGCRVRAVAGMAGQGPHSLQWGRRGDGGANPGSRAMLRVPVSPDPVFVGSAYLRESLPAGNPEGDDDKVYFFFSETGKEFDYFENTIVSRIARVCKVGTGVWGCVRGVVPRMSFTTGVGGMWAHPARLHPQVPGHPSTCGRPLWGNYGTQAPTPGLWLEPAAPASTIGGSNPSPSPLPLGRGDTSPVLLSGRVSLGASDTAWLVPPQHWGCSTGALALLHGWTEPCSARPTPWGSPLLGGHSIVP